MKHKHWKPMSDQTFELWSRWAVIAALGAFLGTWLYLLVPVALQILRP
jgi:hypothetical protein